jgi:glycosyltransferase involved in cell wall biosynthesis
VLDEMRILFATEYYHPFAPGGTAWSLELLAQALRHRGEPVAVVTPNYGAPAREEINGVPVFRFPFWRRLPPGGTLAPVRDHVNPLFHFLLARALVSVAGRFGADVLHAQEKHALVGTYLAARWLGTPVFLSLRDFGLICPVTTCLLGQTHVPADCGSVKLQRHCLPQFFGRYGEGGRFRRLRTRVSSALLYLDAWLKASVVRRLDGVTAVSASLLDIYARAGRVPAGRSHVIYNLPPPSRELQVDRAAALARFELPDRPIVLYVGKASPGKGFPVFLEAARRVLTQLPETCFAVVGEVPGRSAPAHPAIHLLGRRSHAEVETLYALAEVVVHPAVWPEPFSRVPLEAAALGKAVVSTRIGGTPEAVEDKVTGLLVERSDAEGLAQAVEQLLRDPALRLSLGRQAAESVPRWFAPERIAEDLLRTYRQALR